MSKKERFRHELKYSISYFEYLELSKLLKTIMQSDKHTNQDGRYKIRSIYFDNFNDKALHEKIDGVARREKFRIRYYNDNFSFLTLEKKIKHNNLCLKCSAVITEDECRKILNNDISFMIFHKESLVQELYFKMKSQLLKPRVLVSYIREPYTYKFGNVRITFDFQIRTSLYHNVFLEKSVNDISATDTEINNQIIMEVKFDDYLPEVIAHLIQTDTTRIQAFSKYGVCRRFG